jgi:hypothetical protein
MKKAMVESTLEKEKAKSQGKEKQAKPSKPVAMSLDEFQKNYHENNHIVGKSQ